MTKPGLVCAIALALLPAQAVLADDEASTPVQYSATGVSGLESGFDR